MNGEADNSRMFVYMHLAFKELMCRGLIVIRPPHSEPQTGPLEAIEEWSGQQRAGGGLEEEGQPVPCPPPEVNLHIPCNLRGIIWGQDDRKSTGNA